MKNLLASLALGAALAGTAHAQMPAGMPSVDSAKAAAGQASAKASADTSAAKTSANSASTKAAADGNAAKTSAETNANAAKTDTTGKAKAAGAAAKSALDINSASEPELAALPGVGADNAKKIVAARPFSRKDQLVSRKILTKPDYAKIKDLIVAKLPKK